MQEPLISVVMPVRDAAAFIDEAIASIRAQTLPGFELIIVDDGSADASIEIAARHAAQDSRIRILTLPPSGIAVACNHGFSAAQCPYVARMDADDVAKPHRLARQLEVLSASPTVAALGSECEVIDQTGAVSGRMPAPTTPEDIRTILPQANCLAHPSTMLRREAVLAIGGYRPAFALCEDYDLWLRLSERHDLMNVAEPLLSYRHHDRQLSREPSDRRALAVLAAQHAARQRRSDHRGVKVRSRHVAPHRRR